MPQNLNTFIAKNQANKQKRISLANEAKADIKAFIRKNFHLTPEQERGLDSLHDRQIQVIKTAIDRAARGTSVQVQIVGNGLVVGSVRYSEGLAKTANAAQSTTTKPTTQTPSGDSGGDTVTIGGGCGEIDPKTGKVKDCKGTITITRHK